MIGESEKVNLKNSLKGSLQANSVYVDQGG
jgi:hypothetical protein